MNENQQVFDQIKAKHPEWSDEQVWVATSIDKQTDNVIEEAGTQGVNVDDPDIITIIVKKAQSWLEEVMPIIYEKVAAFFNDLLENIKEIIVQGIKDVFRYLTQVFIENF